MKNPIVQVCLECHRWKDDENGNWHPSWTLTQKEITLSHGYCPKCAVKIRVALFYSQRENIES